MEVLSVVAVQVKSVQDAIRDKKDVFNFMGEMIKCVPTVGIFITMNPVCLFFLLQTRNDDTEKEKNEKI